MGDAPVAEMLKTPSPFVVFMNPRQIAKNDFLGCDISVACDASEKEQVLTTMRALEGKVRESIPKNIARVSLLVFHDIVSEYVTLMINFCSGNKQKASEEKKEFNKLKENITLANLIRKFLIAEGYRYISESSYSKTVVGGRHDAVTLSFERY